jgi:hypothetical protein
VGFRALLLPNIHLNSSDYSPLYTSASIILLIILTYEHFNSAKHRNHNACLVYIIAVLRQNVCLVEFILDHLKLFSDLIVYVVIIAILVHQSITPVPKF